MELLIVGLVLVSVAALTGGIAIVLYRQKALKELKGEKSFSPVDRVKGLWGYVKKGILRVNKFFTGTKRYTAVAFALKKINMEDKLGKEEFLFIEQSVSAVLFALGLMVTGDMLLSAAFGAAGFFLPWLVLKSKVRQKEAAILRELPDALDIIAANIEGGLSLNMAISRYASRNRNIFSDELLFVIKKMQLGQSSEEAMRELDRKLEMKEVTSFINAFLQAEKMGGNVKKIIKDQAEEVRKRRFQHLKKLAHEAPVKLLIPLMIFIFPVIFIVLFGPIIIKLMQGF
jgi:tight adherence protein C